MSNLSSFLGGKVKKSQVFKATGTFTPSAALLASGGWVDAFMVGAGGGGVNDGPNAFYSGGGGGGVCTSTIQLSTTQTINVTIGAGGSSSTSSGTLNNGGYSSIHWTSGVTGTVATTSGTTLTVSATNSIVNSSYILLDSEIVYVNSGGGTTSLNVTRAALGTVGASHSAATIYLIGSASGGGHYYSSVPGSGIDYLSGSYYVGMNFYDYTGPISWYAGGGAGGPAQYNVIGTSPANGLLASKPASGIGISGFGAGGGLYTVTQQGANSGQGGNGYTSPASGSNGICILTWFE